MFDYFKIEKYNMGGVKRRTELLSVAKLITNPSSLLFAS